MNKEQTNFMYLMHVTQISSGISECVHASINMPVSSALSVMRHQCMAKRFANGMRNIFSSLSISYDMDRR